MMHNDGCCGGGQCHSGNDDQELTLQEVMDEVGQLLGAIDAILADPDMTAEEKVAAIDELLDPWRPAEDEEEDEA